MYKGIYIALSGAVLKQSHIDVISQNLANANTVGYKRDKIAFQDFLISQLNGLSGEQDGRTMSDVSTVRTDFSSGSIVKTGNPLDIAVEGDGFLVLEGGRYTKRGDLRIDKDGYLITKDNLKVIGAEGPIRLPAKGTIEISATGVISADGNAVGRLKIVQFKDASLLKKAGEDVFTTEESGSPSVAPIKQGFLEMSNVDVVREMVQIITALREFQTYEKAIQSFDAATARVTNEMGRI